MANIEKTTNKYKVKDYVFGNYEHDTIFVEVGENKEIYQIPIKKGISNIELIDKIIVIDKFNTPIEKIVV